MDLAYRVKELAETINVLESELQELKNRVHENDMWDSSDIIRNWKISERTLATWRAEGKIDYVQAGKKIWYPKACRDAFLMKNLVRN